MFLCFLHVILDVFSAFWNIHQRLPWASGTKSYPAAPIDHAILIQQFLESVCSDRSAHLVVIQSRLEGTLVIVGGVAVFQIFSRGLGTGVPVQVSRLASAVLRRCKLVVVIGSDFRRAVAETGIKQLAEDEFVLAPLS